MRASTGPPLATSRRRDEILEQIRPVHDQSDQSYGSPPIHAELVDRQIDVCAASVARYMKRAGIRSKMHRKFKVCTTDSKHDLPVYENKLNRQFTAEAPNRKWLCDITYINTAEGFVYLAAVLDTFSRKIVGWSISDSLDRSLCIGALKSAIDGRRRSPGGLAGLLDHSDCGSQGGFKWSSQHSTYGGCDGNMDTTFESLGTGTHAVAGSAVGGGTKATAAILGGDRCGADQRGRCTRDWRVTSRRNKMVPEGGWNGASNVWIFGKTDFGAVPFIGGA